MTLAPHLLEILRCPKSLAPLIYFPESSLGKGQPTDEFLFCPKSKLKYRIDDGIPVMLIEDAVIVDAKECERLNARATELGLA